MIAKAAPTRVLVANRADDVLRTVRTNLEDAGYGVVGATDGPDLLTKARDAAPALVILDTAMPGMSGAEVLRALKADSETLQIPVMMVTKCQDEIDRVLAFELGAEDYVVSPFSPRELVLRVKAILARCGERRQFPKNLKAGAIAVDSEAMVVTVNRDPVHLTAVEYRLLLALAQAHGAVVSRERLLKLVWGKETQNGPRTVDTHLRRLRAKLGAAAPQIQNVRGFGYRLNG
jgi:two-component system phosphate regulon response regulator PhoB